MAWRKIKIGAPATIQHQEVLSLEVVASAASTYSAAEWPEAPEGEPFSHHDEHGAFPRGAGRLDRKTIWVRRVPGDREED